MNKKIKLYTQDDIKKTFKTQEDLKKSQEAYLKTPLNRDALNQVIDSFYKDLEALNKGFNNCIFKNKKTVNKALIKTFNNVIVNLKTQEDLINIFEFKYSNNKISRSIILNYSPYLLCHNMHSGACNLCNKCYSSKQELSHKKDKYISLDKWLKNYVFFNYLRFIKNPQGLLYRAYLRVKRSYDNKRLKPLIVRFNEKSDIKNQDILNFFSVLSDFFYKELKIKSYTYSKTRGLNYDKTSRHLTVNKSLGLLTSDTLKRLDTYNMFVTVKSQEDLSRLLKKGFIPCQGSCLECGFKCSKLNNKSRVCLIH